MTNRCHHRVDECDARCPFSSGRTAEDKYPKPSICPSLASSWCLSMHRSSSRMPRSNTWRCSVVLLTLECCWALGPAAAPCAHPWPCPVPLTGWSTDRDVRWIPALADCAEIIYNGRAGSGRSYSYILSNKSLQGTLLFCGFFG